MSQPQAVDVLPGWPILPPIFPPISKYEYLEPLPDEIEVADNQATLDYYISIKDIFGQITVNYANTIFPNPKRNSMTFFDDPITTIIPKKYFENPGVATVVGKEFGYCIETVNNLSSVLVFDITHTISKNDSGITIGIVPVIHSNYAFNETTNTVLQGAPNNLCLANPSLTAQIRYLNLEDDANSVKHPNPGDIDYVQSEDNGAYFSSFISKIKGKSQKYEIDEVLSTLKYVVGTAADLFISLLPIPTSASILAEYAVDLVISDIFDEVIGEDYSTDNSIGGNSKNIEIEVGKINETPNFTSAREDDDTFWKIAKLETGGNKQIYVKTDDDYALFMYNIGRPDPINETWDPYTIGIENRLTALIIEDNTSLFNVTPRKIDDFLVDFGLVIGDSIQVAKTKNVKEGNRYSFGHGSGRTQSLKFVPKEAGRYLFTLDNVTCATETIKSSDADFSNPVVKTKWYDYDINQGEKREGKSSISYIVDLEKREYNFTIGDGLTKALQNQGTTGTLEISKIELDNLDIEDYRFGSWERALYVSPSFENGYTIGVSPSKNEIFSLTASPDSPSESASLIYRDSQGRRLSLASGLNSSFFRALPGEKYYFSTKSKSSSSLILEETDLLPTLRKNVGNAFLKVHIDYQKTTDVSYAFMVSEEGLLEIDPHVNYINPNFIIEIENVTTGQKKTAVNGSLSIEVNPDCLYNLNILYGPYTELDSSIIQMILI